MVRLTFTLVTPLIVTEPIHLDAILTAVHPESRQHPAVNCDLRDGCLPDLSLPLKKAQLGGKWVWAASTVSLEGEVKPYRGAHTKRKAREDLFQLEKNVMTIGGVFKDWIVEDLGYACSRVSFLAEPTSLTELLNLASRVGYIGKLGGMGYGQVTDFSVQEVPLPWRSALVQDGHAVRNLPHLFLENEAQSQIAIRPPYWAMGRRELGAAPGEQALLKSEVGLC